jgi:hypothetical protein
MKTLHLLIVALFAAIVCQAQPVPGHPPGPAPEAAKDPVNYVIRIEWHSEKENLKFLQLLTGEGQFELNTIQKNTVKINDNDIPITLKMSGSLTALDGDKGRLQLFLGRTVPYVTGTAFGLGKTSASSYSQMSVGVNSTFIVKFGKEQTIQADETGEISVLVKLADK